jgi:hypothetical protein
VKDVLPQLTDWTARGERVALAIVVEGGRLTTSRGRIHQVPA